MPAPEQASSRDDKAALDLDPEVEQPFLGVDSSELEADSEASTPQSSRRRRRRLAVSAFLLWTLGVAAAGAAVGYVTWDRVSPHAAGPVTIERPTTTLVDVPGDHEVVMPDVVALSRQAALEALGNAGIDPSTVAVAGRPYAAPVGSVVAQEPLGGTASPGTPKLFLATQARMPKTVGTAADAASALLEGIGAVVQARQVYAPGVTVGKVVRTTPLAGRPVTGGVTLYVSSAPAALFMSDLDAARLDCFTDSASVAGREFSNSILCSGGSSEPSVNTWVVDKRADGISFAAGLSSDSDPAGSGTVVVRADGTVLETIPIRFGSARTITLPLSGVTQLTLEVTASDGATGVLGDARFLGSATNIGALQARS